MKFAGDLLALLIVTQKKSQKFRRITRKQIKEIYEFGKDKHLAESDNPNYIGQLNFVFAKADFKNKNDRKYPAAILKREVEKMSARLQKQDVAGRIEHSDLGGAELHKISHVITDVKFDEKTKEAIASAKLLNTTSGRDLKTLVKTISLGASMVGHGNISSDGVVADDYSLSQIDLVKNPSFGDLTKVGAENLCFVSAKFGPLMMLTKTWLAFSSTSGRMPTPASLKWRMRGGGWRR